MPFIKDFDGWNTKKKAIDASAKRRFYKPREIWWCALGTNVGYEVDGKGPGYQRPVLVLKSLGRETFLAIPLTTSGKAHKYRIPVGSINGRDQHVILSQIRVVDAKRLVNKLGILDMKTFEDVRKSAIAML